MRLLRNRLIIGIIFGLFLLAGFKKFVFDEISFLRGENAYLRANLDFQQRYITKLEEGFQNQKTNLLELDKRLISLEATEKQRNKELIMQAIDIKVYNSTGRGVSVTLFLDNKEVANEVGLNSGFWKTLGIFKIAVGSQIRLVAKVVSSPEINEFLATHILTGSEDSLKFIITSAGITEVM